MIEEAKIQRLYEMSSKEDRFPMNLASAAMSANYDLESAKKSVKTWGESMIRSLEHLLEDAEKAGTEESSNFGFTNTFSAGRLPEDVDNLRAADKKATEIERLIDSYLESTELS